MKKTGIFLECTTCFKSVYVPAWRIKQGFKFCSRTCFRHSDETKQKLGKLGKGREAWNKNRKTGLVPKSAFKAGFEPWNKGKEFLQIKGEKNKNWKGGITKLSQKIRSSLEYKFWRQSVFKRDCFTCQGCGEQKTVSGKLEADHIKPFALFPELRFEISNGRTL